MTLCKHELTAGTCAVCRPRPPRTRPAPRRRPNRNPAAVAAATDRAWAAFDREVDEALAEVETAVATCKADGLGTDASEADLYYELSSSIAAMYSPKVGAEVRRRLGF